MAKYSIKDLEQLSGIKAHTIRIWEKRYEIIKPARTNTNIRYYSNSDLKKILNISILNKSGVRISEIATLTNEEIKDKVVHLANNSKDSDTHVENLVMAMIEMNESKFEKLLSRLILQNGFRKTVIEIIFPFLEKIGILWQIGSINPAQEHFVSNIIRRKFIVAIDSQTLSDKPISTTFVLFMHENEHHELTLLFYNYVLRRKGFQVIYLGQSVPYKDVIQSAKAKSADYLLTSLVINLTDEVFTEFTNNLARDFSGKQIFITGKQAFEHKNELPEKFNLISSHQDFEEYLETEEFS